MIQKTMGLLAPAFPNCDQTEFSAASSRLNHSAAPAIQPVMIRKLKSGEYRLYSRKINPKTGRRRNLGTFKTREQAQKHERAVQYFKRAA